MPRWLRLSHSRLQYWQIETWPNSRSRVGPVTRLRERSTHWWRNISISRSVRKEPFAMPWAPAPSIIAEALVEVPDALLTVLRPGPLAPPAHLAAYLARSLGRLSL